MALDERLERELDRAARPADPSGVYEDLIRRRERARIRRRVSAATIAFVVFAGGVVGLYALSRTLDDAGGQPAAYGPLTGRILFTDLDPSRGIPEITAGWYLASMAPDGTDLVDLQPAGLDEVLYPTASPDGSRIAFTGYTAEPETRAVYVMDTDGVDPTPIVELDQRHQVESLAWSPEGSRIALIITEFTPTEPRPEAGARDFDQTSTVWTMATDGSDLVQVTTVGRERDATWSPDGSRIAFDRYEPIDPERPVGATDIFVVDADGSGELQLTHDGRSSEPAWSPDGSTIAFSRSSGEGYSDLYLMDGSGSNIRRVTSGQQQEIGPVWAPDGQALVYGETTTRETDNRSICHISTIRPDGTEHRVLTSREECPSTNGLWWSPTPSEDLPAPTSVIGPTAPAGTTNSSRDGTMDIGLGSSVCDVTSVRGTFEPGLEGTAFVATKANDAGCPQPSEGAFQILAVDVSGDGRADVSYGPLECDPFCSAFAAPDIDGDGQDELLIKNVQFSIAGVKLYEVIGDRSIVPITVGGEGTAPFGFEGFEGGSEPQFWIGGDAGNADAIRCQPIDTGFGRAFVSVTSHHDIENDPDIEVKETTFTLKGTFLNVVNVSTFTWAVDDERRPFLRTDGCGTSFPEAP